MPLPEERGGGALRRRPMCVARGKVRGYKMAFATSKAIPLTTDGEVEKGRESKA